MSLIMISIQIPEQLRQHFENTKQLVNNNIHSLTEKAQQTSSSLQEITTETKAKAIDSVRDSFGKTLQTAERIQQSTSTAIQSSINSPLNEWLQQHPLIYQLVKFLGWASIHPIWGVVIFLLVAAIAWSLIRAIARFIESASLSIIKTPLKVIWLFCGYIWQSFSKLTISNWNKLKNTNQPQFTPLIDASLTNVDDDKQRRLAAISMRLTEIHSEQSALLAEAAELLKSKDKQNHYIEIYPVKNEV
jgi:hypothetical protein